MASYNFCSITSTLIYQEEDILISGTALAVPLLLFDFIYFVSFLYSVCFLALSNFCILSAIKTIQLLKCSSLSADDGTFSTLFLLFILFKILSFLTLFFNIEVNGSMLQILKTFFRSKKFQLLHTFTYRRQTNFKMFTKYSAIWLYLFSLIPFTVFVKKLFV